MFKIDTAKCTLFTSQIYDQVKDHYLYFDLSGGIGCRFDFKNSTGTTTSLDTEGALSRIQSLISDPVSEEIWTPCFQIATTSPTMPYYDGELNKKPIIGFNNFLSFSNPQFKDLSFSGDVSIGVDWILNDYINTDITPVDGVLFWYKKDRVVLPSSNLDSFSVGDWIYGNLSIYDKKRKKTFDPGTVFVKISSDQLQALPINVTGNNTNRIGRTLDTPLGTNIEEPSVIFLQNLEIQGSISWTLYNSIYKLKSGENFYSIHIPDGDYFRYLIKDGTYNDYISKNLMPTFRATYSWLCSLLGNQSGDRAKNLKRLAYILSTGPQVDKLTYNYTTDSNLQTSINSFLSANNPAPSTAIPICNQIYSKLKNLYTGKDYQTSNKSYYINPNDTNALSIYSKVFNDIYTKLVNKYGLYIKFKNQNARLNIKKDMFWTKESGGVDGGPNISVILDYLYWTDRLRDIRGEASSGITTNGPGHAYYDQTIKAGPLQIKTDISNSHVKFQSTDSPDADVWAKLIKAAQNPRFNSESKNYILVPEIKYCMFYKQGAMKIATSTCYIDEQIGAASIFNGKLDSKAIFLKTDKLSSSWTPTAAEKEEGLLAKRYSYSSDLSKDLKQPSLSFSLYNNTDSIKLYSIMINFLRYNDSSLCNCESFYQESISRSRELLRTTNTNIPFLGDIPEDTPRTVGYRRIGYCNGYMLGPPGDEKYTSNSPSVSTKYSPPIKAYGGYDRNIISTLGISLPDHPDPGFPLPAIEDRNINYVDDIKCYMRSGYVKDANLFPANNGLNNDHLIGSFQAKKGFFHPHMGWIGQDHALYETFKNYTAVWAHKPDLKSRFIFKGIGFIFDDDSPISEKRKSYRSTIKIEKGKQSLPKDEINIHTGERNINGRPSTYSTYYDVDSCIPVKVPADATALEKLRDNPCDGYFPVVTYKVYPMKDENGTAIVNETKLDELRIKDISLQLNFLNFDNTTDMKIYLKATFQEGTSNISNASDHAIVSTMPTNLLDSNNLNGYITELVSQNPNDTIVLLNREFIQNYGKDFVLTFSDYADIGTVFNDINITPDPPNYSSYLNRSLKHNDLVHPSHRVSSKTESACNIIKEKLNNYGVAIINNKFRKWYGKSLIGATFKLHIDIDNNYPNSAYGSILNLQYKDNASNLDQYESNVVSNSLCNWKLIIDTYKTSDTDAYVRTLNNINNPITEFIDYTKGSSYIGQNPTNSYSSGYNFLADLSDKEFLVPPVNQNAPLNNLKTYNECIYPKEDYNNFGFFQTSDANLRWLSQAILFSLAATSVGMMFAGGGIGGGLVGLGLFSAAANAAMGSIYNWFANKRQSALVDAFDLTFYDPVYDRYGYGYPDKVLVEISNDGGYNWYTFDANIFKYNKLCSPIYKPLMLGYSGGGVSPAQPITTLDNKDFNDQKLSPETYETSNNNLIFRGDLLTDKRPQIIYQNTIGQSSCIFKPSDNWETFNQNKLVFSIPLVAPFYVFKTGLLNYAGSIDILLHNHKDASKNRKLLTQQTITGMALHPYEGTFRTFLSIDRPSDIPVLYFRDNTNSTTALFKIGLPAQRLGLSLMSIDYNESDKKFMHLDLIRFLETLPLDKKPSNYYVSSTGEGSWGFGSGDVAIRNISYIPTLKDINLIDYSWPKSNLQYSGEIFFPKNSINVTNANIYIGLFDNMNAFPLQQNKILTKHKNYKDNKFYIYSLANNQALNNSLLDPKGLVFFKQLLFQVETVDMGKKYHKHMVSKLAEIAETDPPTIADNTKTYSDGLYWFNIDKEQYGIHTQLTGIKVLDNIKYGCSQVHRGSLQCPNICGDDGSNDRDIKPQSDTSKERIEIKTFRVLFNTAASASKPTIEYKNANVDAQKSAIETEMQAKNITIQWEKIAVERKDLQISCETVATDTILAVREEYWVPKNAYNNNSKFVKASSIVDDKSQILVRFKNITRKLKNFDMLYDRYILSPKGTTSYGGVSRTDGMNVKNTFLSWVCSFTQKNNPGVVRNAVPSYYKILNEMIFRGFFGSRDGVEMKTFNLKTMNIFEWIPYEYDTSTTGCDKPNKSSTSLLE